MKAAFWSFLALLLVGCPLNGQISQPAELPKAPSQSILKSRSFLLPHASMFLSVMFDGEMSRNFHGHDCHEGNPLFRSSSGDFKAGQFYAYNLSLGAGISTLDYLLRQRFPHNRWITSAAIATPLAVPSGTVQHMWGGLSWLGCP